MAAPTFETTPTIVRIYRLLEEVRDGQLLIPRFQRPFVWTDEQRLELMMSVVEGIPIGSLLVWRTSKHRDLGTYPLPGSLEPTSGDGSPDPGGIRQYLLDGHQRVTTLFMALGPGLVQSKEGFSDLSWIEENEYYAGIRDIYYDLQEQRFEIPGVGKLTPPTWVPLRDLFDDYALFEITGRLSGHPHQRVLVNRARNLHKTFYDYPVAVVPIPTDDLDIAVKSFERANTAGTYMSEAHMISALTWARGFDLNDALGGILSELGGWQNLDAKIVLMVCKAQLDLELFTKQSAVLTEKIRKNNSLIEDARDSLSLAIDFLARRCDVCGDKVLPYSYQIVLIADVLRRNASLASREVLEDRLEHWFWRTTYIEYFASISSTRLRVTLKQLRDVAESESEISFEEYLPERYADFKVQSPGRFDFRAARSRAMALMMAAEKPCEDAHRLLADHGKDAMPKLFNVRELGTGDEGFENRFITLPRMAADLRRQIREARPADSALLLKHGITKEAAVLLRKRRYQEALSIRREYFLSREKAFVESLGLTYVGSEERGS